MTSFLKTIPKYWLVAFSSIVSKMVTALIQLIVIQFLLKELGVDSFSTFSLLAGLAAWGLLSDVGIGYSLQNFISEQRAAGQDSGAYIATAVMLIMPLLLLIITAAVSISPWLSSLYLKGDVASSSEGKSLVFLMASLIFIFSAIGSIAYKVLFAEQKGWLANIYIAVGWLAGLACLFVFSMLKFELSILASLVLFYSPSAILAFSVFCRLAYQNKKYFIVKGNLIVIRDILKRSMSFWIFAILSTLVLQADYLVMSQRLDSGQISEYVILLKIFGLSTLLYQALLQALWPVCAELRAKGKWLELKVFVNRYLLYAMVAILTFTFLIILFRSTIFMFIGESLLISPITLLLFGLYFLTRAWTDTYAVLLQSMNLLKPLWCLVPIQAVFSLSLQWVLAEKYGVDGLVAGLTLSFLLTVSIGLPYCFYCEIRKKTS